MRTKEYREIIHKRISNLMAQRDTDGISQDVYAELYVIKAALRDLERMEQEVLNNLTEKLSRCRGAFVYISKYDEATATEHQKAFEEPSDIAEGMICLIDDDVEDEDY